MIDHFSRSSGTNDGRDFIVWVDCTYISIHPHPQPHQRAWTQIPALWTPSFSPAPIIGRWSPSLQFLPYLILVFSLKTGPHSERSIPSRLGPEAVTRSPRNFSKRSLTDIPASDRSTALVVLSMRVCVCVYVCGDFRKGWDGWIFLFFFFFSSCLPPITLRTRVIYFYLLSSSGQLSIGQ